jgi:ectoine hydroxylase-related dioxygenase (phytanoyl-CoA dioxygenase family)
MIPSYFGPEALERMLGWVREIERWPLAQGRHLNYYEVLGEEKFLSRTENFLPFHEPFKVFLRESGVFEMVMEILGEPVVLFKEKINYKYPGTGAYPAHQDVHAHDTSPYAFQPYHKNVVIFLDESDEKNGCLEFGWGYQENHILDRYPTGAIKEHEIAKLDWRKLPCPAGSMLFFDMYWPHRSPVNSSGRPRRTIFLTFNGVSKGDLREAHYKDRASGKAKSREIKSDLVVQTLLFPPK